MISVLSCKLKKRVAIKVDALKHSGNCCDPPKRKIYVVVSLPILFQKNGKEDEVFLRFDAIGGKLLATLFCVALARYGFEKQVLK